MKGVGPPGGHGKANVNSNLETNQVPLTPPPRVGLAIGSLALGIVACLLSPLLIGSLFGLVGLLLGVVHLRRKLGPPGMARWGVGLSVMSLLACLVFGTIFYSYFKQFRSMNSSAGGGIFADWVGAEVPDFSAITLDGKTIRIRDFRGKRVVLDFWATWCGPCVMEIPHFIRLYNETTREDLMILGVSNEEAATIRAFATKQGVNYPVASIGGLPFPYNKITFIPTTFFIDRKGVLQSVSVGYHGFNELKEQAQAKDHEGPPKPAPAEPARIP
jgi:thiol-disulfide isomerase/thioredoxin